MKRFRGDFIAGSLFALSVMLFIWMMAMPIRKSYLFTLDSGDRILVTCDTERGRYVFRGSDEGFEVQDEQGDVLAKGKFSYDTSFGFYKDQAQLVAAEVIKDTESEVMYVIGEEKPRTVRAFQVAGTGTLIVIESSCDRDLARSAAESVTAQAEGVD